ncbi:alginate lyase family protein [Virgibacillus salinus]|uniref:Heparinase II/III N-terminus n=1 Tax=Virgibacillus salinus TaxID=553311 RepID=A0A1H0YIH3_9BACI|nr:alginate lyase family protein [Virgibacillus salinus]SDQ15024.1 Heparinase II/III N-terminus [Virgibacillus salinus]
MKGKIKNYCLLMSRISYKQFYYRMIKIVKSKFIYPKWGRKLFPFGFIIKGHYLPVKYYYNWTDFKEIEDIEGYKWKVRQKANDICDYKFTFLNITHQFKEQSVDWENDIDTDKLWFYYLHYFEYLLVLIESYNLTKDKKYIDTAQELVNDWIDQTYPGQRNSWEAYTISQRLIYWSYLWELLQETDAELFKGFKDKFIGSVDQQARFLYSNLEKDLANNHFTANGKALFWIGITFPFIKKSGTYLRVGIKVLHSQLIKEVREDGSQYENSTSYQVMTAKDYIEVLIYAKKNNISLPKEFFTYTEKMYEFILNILKPDKTLPLLNDSVKNYPVNVNELFAIAAVFFNRNDFKFAVGKQPLRYLFKVYGNEGLVRYNRLTASQPIYKSLLLKGSNYGVMRSGWENGSNYLLFDAGSVGPNHNAGHAHADNLSVYLHANNEDIFIDPGTYEYKAGEKRDYYRSTKAHNTIEVENENQTTFWGAFRPGYIAKSKLNYVDLNSSIEKFSALHDGYKRLKQCVTHKREVLWDKDATWCIKDSLTGKGLINGKLYFQVGKTCKNISIVNNTCKLIFKNSIVCLTFTSNTKSDIKFEKTWISEQWKTEIETRKIIISFNGPLPITMDTKVIVENKEFK